MKNKKLTGYPSIDLPQSKEASFYEKHPIIPNVDLITILKILSKKHRKNYAIDCNDLRVTYQQLIDDSHTLYLAFKELGIKKGEIVTVSLPSNYQAIITFFALNELGAVTTYIDTYCNNDEIFSCLKKYNSSLFINCNKTKEENKEIKNASNVKCIITLDGPLANTCDICMKQYYDENNEYINFHSLGIIAKKQKDQFHLPNKGSMEALILYTSGSTGLPKSVVLTNKNILSAQMYAGNTSHTENITGTKTMTCVPIRYPYGMVTSLLTSLLWRKEVIMAPDWDSDKVEYYYEKKPNIVFGSPAILELTMKYIPDDMDLSQISHFISGGDFLTLEHAKRAYHFFDKHNNTTIELGNGCGNAETVSIGSTPVGVPLKQSTAGKILVGTIPLLIDKDIPDDKPIVDGNLLQEKKYHEVGELCLSGEYVFKEYFGEPDKTQCAKFVRKGKTFFRTGTLGYIDEDGYFTPTDRKSRFYIRSTGHKVYLDNIQRLVGASDSRIVDCAAIKYPDDNELYVSKVFVVLESDIVPSDELKAEMLKKLRGSITINGVVEQLKEYEIPADIIFIDELPRIVGTEKIDYCNLEEKAKGLKRKI